MNAALTIELSKSSVAIWAFPTTASRRVIVTFERTLAPEERDRAARFRFPHLAASFVLARGALRHVLGHYLNCTPVHVPLVYGFNGKPGVEHSVGLEFNMSHSGELALIALTVDREIGIDVELVRPLADLERIAGEYFCPEEASEVMSLSQDKRARAFFLCWTRKEAYIKATGDGLSAPLRSFRVTLHPDTPARFLYIQNNRSEAKAWTLHDLQVADGYAAALAYRDQPRSTRLVSMTTPEDFL